MNARVTVSAMWVSALLMVGCAGNASNAETDGDVLQGVDETQGSLSQELSSGVPLGSTLSTTGNLNLRTGAGTGYHVRLVIPKGAHVTTVNRTTPSGGWYNIKYNGVTGWSSGSYLKLVSSPSGGGGGSSGTITSNNRDGAILRAKSGVGATYWWGHGRWVPGSSNAGSCSGSCPSCSHHGATGADCSGYVAKIWEVPSSNNSLSSDAHPYSTSSFSGSNSQWHTISRSSLARADALVYRSGGSGHIVLYESGDGWGSFWAYEAKGCSWGIRHNIRTASSAFKSIRHY